MMSRQNPPRTRRRVRRFRLARLTFLAATGAAALAASAAADEINLRGSVRLPQDTGVIRLADVAELEGSRAEHLAETIVARVEDGAEVIELSVGEVRRRLTDAGAHWGKIQLNGRRVIVRAAARPAASPPMAMTPASVEPADNADRTARPVQPEDVWQPASELVELATLRGALARAVASGLAVEPAHLRLAFDARDAALLETDLGATRFEIQPLSSLRSDRIELSVRPWSDDGPAARRVVRVRPMIRTETVVLRRDLQRGDRIREADCALDERWASPGTAAARSSLVEAVGRVADRALEAGDILKTRHLKRETLVSRGDRVLVRCLVGGVVITLEAEARSDAAEGETVELRKPGERETFVARVVGHGAAVVDLSR